MSLNEYKEDIFPSAEKDTPKDKASWTVSSVGEGIESVGLNLSSTTAPFNLLAFFDTNNQLMFGTRESPLGGLGMDIDVGGAFHRITSLEDLKTAVANLPPTVSTESGDSVDEIEYTFFLKLEDFSQLERLCKYKEKQDQWGTSFLGSGMEVKPRARRTQRDGQVKYFLCTKIDFPGLDGNAELEQECTMAHYDLIRKNARTGMIKTRYFFPINGTSLVWEIDVFYDEQKNPVPWVKVDLEVPQRLEKIPPFPVEYTDSVVNQGSAKTEKEVKLVRSLFKNSYSVDPKKS